MHDRTKEPRNVFERVDGVQLASVEVIPYALPFKEPYVTARGVLERREMVLLRVRDADGVVGLGEAVPLSLRGGVGLPEVVAELEGWAEHRQDEGLSAPAACAVAEAKMDLLGRRQGDQRTHNPSVAGGDEAVPCNATLVAGEPRAVAADAERWAQDGFTTFKLKLGAESVKTRTEAGFSQTRDADVEQVRAVREAVGPEARIRVDVNAAWDLETAQKRLGELEPFGIELAEQPVSTLEEMAELAAATSIPLAADESVASLEEAERAASMG
ncbi:MAG TPA: enolase C-terminal domain-like protein, partial [Solirubrobacterales bacterium]|nr:enolase C-terminal domain-like protein [Solirubrobacterales bacterium]